MQFPRLTEAERIARLELPAVGDAHPPLRMVLDTDTYNEIDDQFAVAYALLSPQRLQVEAIYAAPFLNDRSSSPGDGMEKSYDEILRLLARIGRSADGLVHRGSTSFLPGADTTVASAAARDLVTRAIATPLNGPPLYVVAIGALTNVASAILLEPEIIRRIVVVWLGGQPLHHPAAREFNLRQDLHASRLLFDCGVPLVHVPCLGVASHLLTTVPELEASIAGKNALCDYLVQTVKGYRDDHFAWAKEIWDIAPVGYLINPSWVPTVLDHSPVLTDQLTWSVDGRRHLIRTATFVHRNPIFGDVFRKLAG